MRFAPLVEMADNVLKYKYIVKNVAKKHGKTATFMPKPLFQDNGSGMHVHSSLWKDGDNLFAGSGYAGLSDMGLYAIGGLLRHAPALCAHHQSDDQQLQAPRARLRGPGQSRLQPPQSLGVDPHPGLFAQPQGQAHRVPLPRRLEQSVPRLLRHADGHDRRHQEQDPARRAARQGHLRPGTRRTARRFPRRRASLDEALNCLEHDHEFLLQGDVFTEDVISTWIWYKREKEVDAIRLRPHPYEFMMYFDI